METHRSSPFTNRLTLILFVCYALSLTFLTFGNILAGDTALWQMLLNGLILSIPLGLLYTAIGLLITAYRQHKNNAQISPALSRLIYWSPRIAGIIIIGFVSLFALDSFDGPASLGEKLLGFLMHMLPSIAMMIFLAIAWRHEAVGFFGFLALALFFLRFIMGNPLMGLGNLLLFNGPMLVIALLFYINWRWKSSLTLARP